MLLTARLRRSRAAPTAALMPPRMGPARALHQGDVQEPAGPRCAQGRVQYQAIVQLTLHRLAWDSVNRHAGPRSCWAATEGVVSLHQQPASEEPLRTPRPRPPV